MIVRLTVIVLLLVLTAIYSQGTEMKRNSSRNRKKYIFSVSVILILQSGLRNVAVGADTLQYFFSFKSAKGMSWSQAIERIINHYQLGIGKDPGYLIFEKASQLFLFNYQLYLILIAVLFFGALGRFIYYNTSKLSHAMLAYIIYSVLFYSFFSITGHRQTIATAAALFSFEWIKRRQLFPFLLLLAIASTIHKSVLLFVPFYFIGHLKRSNIVYKNILLIFPFLMVFRNQISSMFKAAGGFEEYEVYEKAGTLTFTALYLLISIFAILRMPYVLKLYPKSYYYFNALAIGLFFIPLTWVNPSAMRVVQYFSIYMLLAIPIVIESFKMISNTLRKGLSFILIGVLILLFLKTNLHTEYAFFWQEMSFGKNYE